jgi:hypothetical protein
MSRLTNPLPDLDFYTSADRSNPLVRRIFMSFSKSNIASGQVARWSSVAAPIQQLMFML